MPHRSRPSVSVPVHTDPARQLTRLNALAQTSPDAAMDYLAAHPDLVTLIDAMRLETRAAPTGSTPQAGGGWASSFARDVPNVVPNARTLRIWADSHEWVRAAIDVRKDRIGNAAIAVLPDDESKPYDRRAMAAIERLLRQPNEYRQNWSEFLGAVVEDVLVLGRGCISKNLTRAGEPVSLYVEDGATIGILPSWDGTPAKPRYLYEDPGGSRKVWLTNQQLICIMTNVASYRYGLSPVQVLRDVIQADIQASQSAARLVSNKPPPHLVQVPGASKTVIRSIVNDYQTDISGQKELFFMGVDGDVRVFPLVFSAKDNQWLEWQLWLARKICAVFHISPQQIGITFDINRATGETQMDISEDIGLVPLMLTFERYFNNELLADFAPLDRTNRPNLAALNLKIVFPEVSEAQRMLNVEKTLKVVKDGLAGLPSLTLNEAKVMMGHEPVPGGNTFYTMTTNGPMPWLSYDQELGDYGPVSTSGDLGAQDPAGGPDGDAAVPDGEMDGSSADDVVPPTVDTGTKRYDPRPAGTNWHAGLAHTTAKPRTPRERLAREARTIFLRPRRRR